MTETNYLPKISGREGTYFAFRVGHLEVIRSRPRSRRRLSYLIANLTRIESSISFSINGLALSLRPIRSTIENIERLGVLRGALPTARIETETRASLERVTRTVDEVCYLLSLARGTKVQWIALTEQTRALEWVRKHHYSRVTKRYCPLPVVDIELGDYLREAGSGRYRSAAGKSGTSDAVIDAYIEGKSEGDFLQARALKLVVAVEMLKAEYVERSGAPSYIVPPNTFSAAARNLRLKKDLKASLAAVTSEECGADSRGEERVAGVTSEERSALYRNLMCLNRVSFADHLKSLCSAIRMPASSDELSRFIASRNKLVHEGRFYCERATPEEALKTEPLANVVSEWFWLLHFVDRPFLRAIDYEGPYIDWSTPSDPKHALLCPAPNNNMQRARCARR